MRPHDGDEVLVRRAAGRVALQVTALVGTAMLLVLTVVSLIVLRQQRHETDLSLRRTALTADDVQDPPAGSWLLIDARTLEISPGLDPALLPQLSALREQATPAGRTVTISRPRTATGARPDVAFRVLSRRRGSEVVQVVADLGRLHVQRDQLLAVTGTAAGLSLLAAAGLGLVVGRRAVRPLADALALQRAFVADASHELRTPLTLLSTRVQVLERHLRRVAVDEGLTGEVAGVVSDVQRLGHVVEDLLAAADPHVVDAGDEVDVVSLVRDAASSAQAHCDERRVRLETDLPTDALLVTGSTTALRRAVLSLVDNAVDHTPENGTVSLAVRRERSEAVISVADTGPGLSETAARSAVRRFHSGGQRAGRAHYGLGLALTHDVANRHGGQLRLVPGQVGATFEISLPLAGSPRKR